MDSTSNNQMSAGKIKIPDGMVKASVDKMMSRWEDQNDGYRNSSMGVEAEKQLQKNLPVALEAALRWLSENPIVPTLEQTEECRHLHRYEFDPLKPLCVYQQVAVEWQRRMFLVPEPEIPEEIKDLLWGKESLLSGENERVIEAYNRGLRGRRVVINENVQPGEGVVCYTKDSETGIPNSR